nr:hypothetical protein [Bacteroidota bacterium]
MKTFSATGLLFIIGLLLISSCGFQTGIVSEFKGDVIDENQTNFKYGRAWVRSFKHENIGSVTSMYATNAYGGAASGVAVERNSTERPSHEIISVVRNSGVFESVTPVPTEIPYDFIIEGAIDAKWKDPWWNWPQLITLWIHTWILPTLGRNLVCETEIVVLDKNYNPVYSATVNYTKKYIAQIWWHFSHGGAFDEGSNVKVYEEALEYTFNQIRADMAQALQEYLDFQEHANNTGNIQGN